jgi:hypothetical protein
MNTTIKSSIAIILSMVFAIAAAAVLTISASAQEQTITPISAEEPQDASDSDQQVSGAYEFTAQPGDSYTKMARKAVQIYGIDTTTNLSGEQIVFAETNVTQVAGSPVLAVGQKVSIEKSLVSDWVKKATELNDAQKAAWAPYSANVNFNTNSVGE